MSDDTEFVRRAMVSEINSTPSERESLENKYGKVWDTSELTRDFEVSGFLAPFVAVKRKADGKKGMLTFQHHPRYYFGFCAEEDDRE